MPILLASSSARRISLLKAASLEFETMVCPDEEVVDERLSPGGKVMALAAGKARCCAARWDRQGVVIGADTAVFLGTDMLGKPEGPQDAQRMLRRLSGRWHTVRTGVCMIFPGGEEELFCCVSRVLFRRLSQEEIQAYVQSGEPMDKAGAYAIQGGASQFVRRYAGDYDNIVGLPVSRVIKALESFGAIDLI
ncbi:MAG: Maf family protein [Christensenellales bacterium]|jgi:septum formation protein